MTVAPARERCWSCPHPRWGHAGSGTYGIGCGVPGCLCLSTTADVPLVRRRPPAPVSAARRDWFPLVMAALAGALVVYVIACLISLASTPDPGLHTQAPLTCVESR